MASSVLAHRVRGLEKQLSEYRELVSLPLPDPSTIYIGDGYFVTMTLDEAREFLNKKIDSIEQELSALSQLGGVNDEGLPVFDIVEELDEDGNVISSKLNQSGLGNAVRSENSAHEIDHEPKKSSNDSKQPRILDITDDNDNDSNDKSKAIIDEEPSRKAITKTKEDQGTKKQAKNAKDAASPEQTASETSTAHSEESSAQFASSSVSASEDDDDSVQYIEDVSDYSNDQRSGEDESNGEFRDIDPLDVLELELMGEDGDDDENVNFNFDDIEEDDDDDDDDDYDEDEDDYYEGDGDYETGLNSDFSDEDNNFYNGWEGGSLFPQDEATRKLIAAHFAQQDKSSKKDGSEEGKKSPRTTRVRFAENVDVREFETNPSERKFVPFEPPTSKFSRFKIARQAVRSKNPGINDGRIKPASAHSFTSAQTPSPSVASTSQHQPQTHQTKTANAPSAALAAAAAVTRNSQNTQVHGSVVERDAPKAPLKSTSSSPSKFAATRGRLSKSASSVRQPTIVHPQQSQSAVKVQESTPTPSSNLDSADRISEVVDDTPSTQEKSSEHADSNVVQESDESRFGPEHDLKSRVAKDANRIFEDSFLSDEDFLRLHASDSESTTDKPENAEKNSLALQKIAENDKPNDTRSESEKNKTELPGNKAAEHKPILSSVLEREPEEDDEELEEEDHSEGENEVNMTEIKQEYQRLRQKLIYGAGGYRKQDHEKAIEPIAADGNPKKLSRFKAARIV